MRSVSTIWDPIVYTGFSAVIGSWKMTAIWAPRTLRICCGFRPVSSRPSSLMLPWIRLFSGRRSRIAIELALLPEPDSPTRASTSPGLIV